MSMRKYIRRIVKNSADKRRFEPGKRLKTSKVVKSFWEKYQIKRYGEKTVAENRLKGTHKKKTWSTRLGTN